MDCTRRTLGHVLPVITRLGVAVSLEQFDPVGAIIPVECLRPAVPFVDTWEVNTLGVA